MLNLNERLNVALRLVSECASQSVTVSVDVERAVKINSPLDY